MPAYFDDVKLNMG